MRAITELVSIKDNKLIPLDSKDGGIEIQVDIDKLINMICISPYSSEWYELLIKKILSRYSIGKPVKRSSINEKPD